MSWTRSVRTRTHIVSSDCAITTGQKWETFAEMQIEAEHRPSGWGRDNPHASAPDSHRCRTATADSRSTMQAASARRAPPQSPLSISIPPTSSFLAQCFRRGSRLHWRSRNVPVNPAPVANIIKLRPVIVGLLLHQPCCLGDLRAALQFRIDIARQAFRRAVGDGSMPAVFGRVNGPDPASPCWLPWRACRYIAVCGRCNQREPQADVVTGQAGLAMVGTSADDRALRLRDGDRNELAGIDMLHRQCRRHEQQRNASGENVCHRLRTAGVGHMVDFTRLSC